MDWIAAKRKSIEKQVEDIGYNGCILIPYDDEHVKSEIEFDSAVDVSNNLNELLTEVKDLEFTVRLMIERIKMRVRESKNEKER